LPFDEARQSLVSKNGIDAVVGGKVNVRLRLLVGF
jgi:hypothetical protein